MSASLGLSLKALEGFDDLFLEGICDESVDGSVDGSDDGAIEGIWDVFVG